MLPKYQILAVCCLLISCTGASVSSHVRQIDQARYQTILEENLLSNDIGSVHYAIRGLKLLSKNVPSDKATAACKVIADTIAAGNLKPETAYYVTSASKNLGTCKSTISKETDLKVLHDTLNDESASVSDLHYAVASLKNLGKPIDNPTKIVQSLQARLRTEDSLQNLGHTFHCASFLGASGKFALDRIEEALVQADEVDSKLLQFEGGLGVTSLILVGIARLSESQGKTNVITRQQAEKFANYLVSRRSVQTVKGIGSLLEAIRTFTDNKDLSPACILLEGSGHVTSVVSVKICDLLGKPLNLGSDAIIAQSATRLGDDVVVLAKQKLIATADPTIFTLELPRDRMAAGLYRVAISAGPHTASLTVTALANGSISYLEIGVNDADQSSAGKLQRLKYPATLSRALEADSQQRLVIRFAFIDSATNKPFKVQQSFLRLTCKKSDQEILFIAEQDDSNIYRLDLDIDSHLKDFGGQSGEYSIELLLGDIVLSNPIKWTIGSVNLKLPTSTATAKDTAKPRSVRPEIHHQFREAERRPPQFFSLLFTGLAAAPILLLFIIWAKLGINVSNFPLSLSAIVFHVGLASILVLFGVFWMYLNMFQTSRWLLLLGLVTFIAGHRLLRSIAQKRKH